MNRVFLLQYLALPLLWCGSASAADTQLTFEGRFEFRTDSESLEIIGKQVCFYPAPPTSKSVPRPAGDIRLPWFCFSNPAAAAALLGFKMNTIQKSCGLQGDATGVVVGYKRYTGESAGNDVANLQTVLSKSQPQPLPCSK